MPTSFAELLGGGPVPTPSVVLLGSQGAAQCQPPLLFSLAPRRRSNSANLLCCAPRGRPSANPLCCPPWLLGGGPVPTPSVVLLGSYTVHKVNN